jgi:hypothetical protein
MKLKILILTLIPVFSLVAKGQQELYRGILTLESKTSLKDLNPKMQDALYLSKFSLGNGIPSILYIYKADKDFFVIKIDKVLKREFESDLLTKRIEWKGEGIEVATKKKYLVSVTIDKSTSEIVITITDDETVLGYKGTFSKDQ